jgi:serralysin
MNFGWLRPDSTDHDVQSVVLHEFGHALGLIHEHQNPSGDISWNREQVINDLSGYPNYWTLDQIEHNMFRSYAAAETNYTKTDPESIMMYPIPPTWTTNGFTVGLNSMLSRVDRDFVSREYPG